MVAVTSVTSGATALGRRVEALVSVVLCGAIGWCALLVLRADRRAPRHSALRDPISWFASAEAPEPDRLRLGLVVVAAALVVLAVVGWVTARRRIGVIIALVAGALVFGIALAPLDCSIRLDYCEKLVAAGLASDAHLVHVALSAGLVVLTVVAAVAEARRSRRPVSGMVALVVIGAGVAMFAAPTSDLLGTFQLVTLVGGGWASVRLWLSAPTLVSPP